MSHNLTLQELTEVKTALLKPGPQRSYDELLMLKSLLARTDFVKHTVGNNLFPKQMDELCRSVILESFNAGDTLFKQGDVGDRMYIVLNGVCEVRLRQKVELAHGLFEVREKALFQCTTLMNFGEKALQNDEPRGATVVAVQYSDLISIHKFVYNSLIKSAIAEGESNAARQDQPGTKGYTMKILAKKPEFRTKLEIEAVAGYLDWRIPFFRKFTPDQRLELSRVSQSVSIYGETVLFKQGSVGQAFYVVLSGSVEVWVASAAEIAMNNLALMNALANTTGSSAAKGASAGNPLKHGLGAKVAVLTVGDTFGERALENEDSMRMASICTCEGTTDMLVIAREDYHKLVSALTNMELMNKIKLLRSTDMFRDMDAVYLKELARFMEPKRFELDTVLFHAGKKATEMIIIDCGECTVEVPVATFTGTSAAKTKTNTNTNTRTNTNTNTRTNGRDRDRNVGHGGDDNEDKDDDNASESSEASSNQEQGRFMSHHRQDRRTMEVGRIAPHSVLAPYITQVKNLFDQVIHSETVTASTLVIGYTVGLHDFYANMNREAQRAIVVLVKNYAGSTLPVLWETQARRVGDVQWRTKMAWDKYRTSLRNPGGPQLTYTDSLKTFANIHLTLDSGNAFQNNSGAYKPRPEDVLAFYPDMEQGAFGSAIDDESRSVISASSSVIRRAVGLDWGIIKPRLPSENTPAMDPNYNLEAVHPVVQKALQAAQDREKLRAKEDALARESGLPTKYEKTTSSKTDPTSTAVGHSHSHSHSNPLKTIMAINAEASLKKDAADVAITFPFSLVHIHQHTGKRSAKSIGSNRVLQTYIRLCGTLSSCTHAKDAGDLLMQSVLLMQYDSDLSKQSQLQLHWHTFSSFEGMPLKNTDIFLIYCRSVPVEYACLCPEKDMMLFNFPAVCKQKNQFYACSIMRGLSPPEAALPPITEKRKKRPAKKPRRLGLYGKDYEDTDDEGSDDEAIKVERENGITAAGLPASSAYKAAKFKIQLTRPVFLQELGSFEQNLSSGATQKVCILHGKLAQSRTVGLDAIGASYDPQSGNETMAKYVTIPHGGRPGTGTGTGDGDGGEADGADAVPSYIATVRPKSSSKHTAEDRRICVFPLYEWLPISEDTLREYDITNLCNASSSSAFAGEHGKTTRSGGGGIAPAPARGMASTAGPSNLTLNFGDTGGKDRHHPPDDVLTAFKEAGMMPSAAAGTGTGTSTIARSKSLSALDTPFLDSISNRVTSKTLASSISTQYLRDEEIRLALVEQQRLEAAQKRRFDMRPENRATAQRGYGTKKSDPSHLDGGDKKADGEDQQRMSFMESEEKTKSFAEVLKARTRMIALNDKLCYDEGKLRPKKKKKSNKNAESKGEPSLGADIAALAATASPVSALPAEDEEPLSDEEDADNYIGDLSALSLGEESLFGSSTGGGSGGRVDFNTFKRGVTLVASQSGGGLDGPGGMGLLRSRMRMYDSLNKLPPSRTTVEIQMIKDKKAAEEAAARQARKAQREEELRLSQAVYKAEPESEIVVLNTKRTVLVPQHLDVLKASMDRTAIPSMLATANF